MRGRIILAITVVLFLWELSRHLATFRALLLGPRFVPKAIIAAVFSPMLEVVRVSTIRVLSSATSLETQSSSSHV